MKTLVLFLISLGAATAFAQTPTPPMMIVPAANSAPAAAPVKAAPAAQDTGALRSTIQTMEKMKAANEDLLKRQEAILQQLDDLQKAAEQVKIFSHRSGG